MVNLTETNLIIITVPILLITIFLFDQSWRQKRNTGSAEEKIAFSFTFIRFFLASFVVAMFFSADVLLFKTIASMNFTPENFEQNKEFFKYSFLFLAFQLLVFGSNFGLSNVAGLIEKISKSVRGK